MKKGYPKKLQSSLHEWAFAYREVGRRFCLNAEPVQL